MKATHCLQIFDNGASFKIKLELFGKQLSGKMFDYFQHLKGVAANDLDEDKYTNEQTDGGLLGVRSKELVQRRQRSGCRTSRRMKLEDEIQRDIMMSEKT